MLFKALLYVTQSKYENQTMLQFKTEKCLLNESTANKDEDYTRLFVCPYLNGCWEILVVEPQFTGRCRREKVVAMESLKQE